MWFYVSLEGIDDKDLGFLGYVLIAEDDEFKIYYHRGEELVVDKADPFIYVDDLNDAMMLGTDIFRVTRTEEGEA